MRPEEQKQVGEMFGRLMVLDPKQLSQVTQIDPAEIQALMGPQGGAPGQPAPPGATIAPTGAPTAAPAPPRQPEEQPDQGTYGILQNMTFIEDGLTMRDSKTGASRSAKPGEHPGPTEILMHGSEILQMGLRAHATVRMQQKAKEARV